MSPGLLQRTSALLVVLGLGLMPGDGRTQNTATGIRLSTDARQIYVGDSVVIDVESVGLIDPLDTAPLFTDADLLRETSGTRIAVVNGKVVDVHTRRMEFLPRGEGPARFGPLRGETAGGEVRSNRLEVSVLPAADDDWQPDARDATAHIKVSQLDPYVGEELVVDIVLRHRFPIADEHIVLPDFHDFDVLPVFESRRTIDPPSAETSTGTDARGADDASAIRRIAWRYLLWPRRSGTLDIAAVHWRGMMVRSRTRRGMIDTRTAPVALQVRTAPADASGWWLPARKVQLSDQWSSDPRQLTAGQQIERHLVLRAEGVLASQLPAVEPLASRSLSSVFLGSAREQTLTGEQLQASATYRYRLTARSPVPVFLDTVRVDWWNTLADEAAEAIVPARRIDIGLPDRADLLADVALREGRWSRLLLTMSSLRLPTAAGVALAVFLSIALLLTAIAPWWRRRRRASAGSDTSPRSELPMP